jgi:dolichol-phosphate mannosyltransferase
MNFPKFTIIIPIFNEKKNIVELLKNITLKVKKLKFEIFLIDDDSTDGSQELITNYIKNKDDIYLIKRRKKPRDLSLSCIDGFKRSKKKFILVMDGDGQHDPKYINTMVRTINKNDLDIVVGSRELFSRKVQGLNFFRKISSKILILLINFLFGNKTNDPMSGFFIFKREIFLKNKNKLFSKGYKILFDLITVDKKLKIKDIEINFLKRDKGYSKMDFKIVLILFFQIISKILNN